MNGKNNIMKNILKIIIFIIGLLLGVTLSLFTGETIIKKINQKEQIILIPDL